MTSAQVHSYLRELGRTWKNKGTAIELGSWLGATSAALLEGLKEAGFQRQYWAFDRWQANQDQVNKAAAQKITIEDGEDTRPLFLQSILPIYERVVAVKGALPGTLDYFVGTPIEIVLFDAPKQNPIFYKCMKKVLQYAIPGVTTFGLLDYSFYEEHSGKRRELLSAPVHFMEEYKGHFEVVKKWDDETCVFFKYTKKLKL